MSRPKAVKRHVDEILKHDWKDEFQLSDEYTGCPKPFLHVLAEFQFMSDGHLGQVNISKHRTELTPENIQPIHSEPYWAGSKARKFDKAEIKKMLLQKVMEPARAEWTATIVFSPEKDESLCFMWIKENLTPLPNVNHTRYVGY